MRGSDLFTVVILVVDVIHLELSAHEMKRCPASFASC